MLRTFQVYVITLYVAHLIQPVWPIEHSVALNTELNVQRLENKIS